jgi:hypothetical protein
MKLVSTFSFEDHLNQRRKPQILQKFECAHSDLLRRKTLEALDVDTNVNARIYNV